MEFKLLSTREAYLIGNALLAAIVEKSIEINAIEKGKPEFLEGTMVELTKTREELRKVLHRFVMETGITM